MPERITVYLNEERSRRLRRLQTAMTSRSKSMAWSAAKILERAFDLAYESILDEAYQGADFVESVASRIDRAKDAIEETSSLQELNRMALEVRGLMEEIIRKQGSAPPESRVFKECIKVRQRALLLQHEIILREDRLDPHAGIRRAEVALQMEQLRRRIGPVNINARKLVEEGRPRG